MRGSAKQAEVDGSELYTARSAQEGRGLVSKAPRGTNYYIGGGEKSKRRRDEQSQAATIPGG